MSQLEKWVTQKICQLKNGVTLKNVSVFKRWVTFKKSVIQLKKLVTSKEMLYSWKNGSHFKKCVTVRKMGHPKHWLYLENQKQGKKWVAFKKCFRVEKSVTVGK